MYFLVSLSPEPLTSLYGSQACSVPSRIYVNLFPQNFLMVFAEWHLAVIVRNHKGWSRYNTGPIGTVLWGFEKSEASPGECLRHPWPIASL